MSDGDSDFGSEIDDDEFLAVATQVENAVVNTSQLQSLPSETSLSQQLPGGNQSQWPEYHPEDFDDDDIAISSENEHGLQTTSSASRPAAPKTNLGKPPPGSLRQTTLYGTRVPLESEERAPAVRRRFPLANRPDEKPTHHVLDQDAAKTWIYPSQVSFRKYQYDIVYGALFSNLLVALPTGLGKTFIAATVMLNWFRWAPNSQICFVAPTKPLVNQQMEACYNTVGIPRSQTAEMTGGVVKGLRQEYWEERRVFFLTPQTLQNDIKNGLCDVKKIVLLVVDEAHRSTGKYAYGEVVKLIRRENPSFRILALTATPGKSVESVQEVIDALGIARVEIRTDDSIDIQGFIKKREIEIQTFDLSPEQEELQALYGKCLEPMLKKLTSQKAYYDSRPEKLTIYGLKTARDRWAVQQRALGADKGGNYWSLFKTFTVLQSLAHPMRLLQTHGVRVFYNKLRNLRDGGDSDDKDSTAQQALKNDSKFYEVLDKTMAMVDDPNFTGHPKMDHMINAILRHFTEVEDQETKRETRIIVFTSFRDSAEEIVKMLKRHQPMIRPHVFVGQQGTMGSSGMTQKEQMEAIKKFTDGTYNVLVATSIGEEGLDIGEVDLIICYDTSGSGIRMIQRIGRTGRKRNGSVLFLLCKDNEESSYYTAIDEQKVMNRKIADARDFSFPIELSPRILPRDIVPEVERKEIEIPIENTQPDPGLERRRPRAKKKAPPKKFFMPEGVKTGFTKASRLGKESALSTDDDSSSETSSESGAARKVNKEQEELVPIIPDDSEIGMITPEEERDLDRKYRLVHRSNKEDTDEAYDHSRVLGRFPELQRRFTQPVFIPHSKKTISYVNCVKRMHELKKSDAEEYKSLFDDELLKSPKKSKPLKSVRPAAAPPPPAPKRKLLARAAGNASDDSIISSPPPKKRSTTLKSVVPIVLSDDEDDVEMVEDSDASLPELSELLKSQPNGIKNQKLKKLVRRN